MSSKSSILLLWSLFVAAPQGYPQGDSLQIQWHHSTSSALRAAADGDKLIVTFLFADWCGWCRRMDRETWADPSVVAESRRHVFLRLNAEKEADGIELREKYKVRGFPMVLILSSDGGEFERLEGFLPPQKFLESFRTAIADPDSLGNLRAAERRNPGDRQVAFRLGLVLFNRMDFAEAERRFDAATRSRQEASEAGADEALFYLALSQAMQLNTSRAIANLDRLQQQHPQSSLAPKAWLLSGELMVQSGRQEEGRQRIREFLEKHPDHPLAERAKRLLEEK